MKICPVCNDSFSDELNFCDIDGARLDRESGGANGRDGNKWWSLLGAGLLVGAVVISAASIIFLPKARVALPLVNSEPQSVSNSPKAPAVDSGAAVAATSPASEPDTAATDAVAPELKKKDKSANNSNAGEAPNPKAAALAAEGVDKTASSSDPNKNATSPSNKTEAPPAAKPVSDTRPVETATKPVPPPAEVRRDPRTAQVSTKSSDKGSDKKKSDDKEKKKGGGFLRVFKKIFGKD
jgi:hypothetical protein